jgi:hypothetical protein
VKAAITALTAVRDMTMKIIPTRVHGVLDYLSAATLVAAPRLLKWDDRLVKVATALAGITTLYSLATRYELGVVRVLPMKLHLAFDVLSGLGVISSPFWLFRDVDDETKAAIVGFGLFEVAAGALSSSTSTVPEHA